MGQKVLDKGRCIVFGKLLLRQLFFQQCLDCRVELNPPDGRKTLNSQCSILDVLDPNQSLNEIVLCFLFLILI